MPVKVQKTGNAAEMREALVAWLNAFDEFVQKPRNGEWSQHPCGTLVLTPLCAAKLVDMTNSALALPPRNCDVGTAEEQYRRYNNFTGRYTPCSYRGYARCAEDCPVHKKLMQEGHGELLCQLEWSQMPYDAAEGGAK